MSAITAAASSTPKARSTSDHASSEPAAAEPVSATPVIRASAVAAPTRSARTRSRSSGVYIGCPVSPRGPPARL